MHVSARAVGGAAIFDLPMARRRYLMLLARACRRYGVTLLFFVVMWNHVHVLVWGPSEKISRAIQFAHSRFALWVNEVTAGQGHVFQARFDGRVAKTMRHLVALLRYLARNPVAARVVRHPADFDWSADRYYRHGRTSSIIDVQSAGRLIGLLCNPAAYSSLVDRAARTESILARLRRELDETALVLGLTPPALQRGREPVASQARRALVMAWLAAGVARVTIAKVLGVSRSAVNRQLQQRG
jgi:REP element-mobilizing transposase RayT